MWPNKFELVTRRLLWLTILS